MTLEAITQKCIDPGFGYENGDGYVRIWDIPRALGGRLVMRHRWFWEMQVSEIPEGYEIDHLCKNRRCCNVEHLQVLTRSEHKTKDNTLRYKDRFDKFREFYLSDELKESQGTMGKDWGVTQSCISVWIKKINIERETHGVKRKESSI